VWDSNGNLISSADKKGKSDKEKADESGSFTAIKEKIEEITELKKEATKKYGQAKENIKKVLNDIKKSGGKFDYDFVENTVDELLDFLTENNSAFSYLSKELFSYDDYLFSHSTNVCTVGSAILNRFNVDFPNFVNKVSAGKAMTSKFFKKNGDTASDNLICYNAEEIKNISIGYFLHDIGKVLIPEEILNKKGRLTEEEFTIVKKHSYEMGVALLQKNNQTNPFIVNIVKYHHSALFYDETNCYPAGKKPKDLPPYVKICKFADIYDAMTSKRSYKNAFNPIGVVTSIFREYAGKDKILQFILNSFIKSIGICPPGGIVYLQNNQMAYVLDSAGPLVLPFTDSAGKTLVSKPDVIDLGQPDVVENLKIDSKKIMQNPVDVHKLLPAYLKEMINI